MTQQNESTMQKNEKRKFSRPQFPVKLSIANTHAQQIFESDFEITSKAIYYLSVIMRVIDTETNADVAENEINKILAVCLNDLKNRQEVTKKLLHSEGYGEPDGYFYSDVLDTTVTIDSPRLLTYLNIIRELDNHIKLLDIAWFYGQMDDKMHSQEIFKAKRSVVKTSFQVRQLWLRVLRAARAKNINVKEEADQTLTVVSSSEPIPDTEPLPENVETMPTMPDVVEVIDAAPAPAKKKAG